MKQTKILQFKVIIEQDEDGWYVATVPSIPGCHTQGRTYEEAVKNIKEAIELCLEVANDNKAYYDQIDWEGDEKTKFIGIIVVPMHQGRSLGKGLLHSILHDIQIAPDEFTRLK